MCYIFDNYTPVGTFWRKNWIHMYTGLKIGLFLLCSLDFWPTTWVSKNHRREPFLRFGRKSKLAERPRFRLSWWPQIRPPRPSEAKNSQFLNGALAYFYEIQMSFSESASKILLHIQGTAKYILYQTSSKTKKSNRKKLTWWAIHQ